MAAQALIGLAAVGLVVANEWKDRAMWAGAIASPSSTNPASFRSELVRLGEMVAGVVVITVIAGVNGQAAAVMGVLVLILWLLFLIHRAAPGSISAVTKAATTKK
jgi:hypothetical protein